MSDKRVIDDGMGEEVRLLKIDEDGKYKIQYTTVIMGKEYIDIKTYNKEKVRDKRFNEFNDKRATRLIQTHMDEAISNQLSDDSYKKITDMDVLN